MVHGCMHAYTCQTCVAHYRFVAMEATRRNVDSYSTSPELVFSGTSPSFAAKVQKFVVAE